MRVVGFIPARSGSKGLPGKNKKLLLGKPLISYSIEAALSSTLDDIIVSSDDDDIVAIAESYNVKVLKRPDYLSGDLVPTLPVLQHAIATINADYDAVMTLQPTSPLRSNFHINEAISLFRSNDDADSLVSIVKVPHKFIPNSLMKIKGKFLMPIDASAISLRRQDKPEFLGRNGAAIYITRISKIGEFIFGGKILPYEMNKLLSIDIDDIEDWMMAEAIMKYIQQDDITFKFKNE